MNWSRLRKRSDAVILIRAKLHQDGWKVTWEAAHWLPIDQDMPPGLAAAVSGAFWKRAMGEKAGDVVADTAARTLEQLWRTIMNKEDNHHG